MDLTNNEKEGLELICDARVPPLQMPAARPV